MSGRIQESDFPILGLDRIGSNGLRDSSGLLAAHIGLAYFVQKRGLTVIDMTHDNDNRRSGYQALGIIILIGQELLDHVFFFLRLADTVEFLSDLLRLFVVQLCIDSGHRPLHKKVLDHLGWGYHHLLSQRLNGQMFRKLNRKQFLHISLRSLVLISVALGCGLLERNHILGMTAPVVPSLAVPVGRP